MSIAIHNRVPSGDLFGGVGSPAVLTITRRAPSDEIRIVIRTTTGTLELGMSAENLALCLTGLAECQATITRTTSRSLPNVPVSNSARS
jgi:hypothetical protein